ncbi:permease-like cell division protein FtsX [Sporosarcina sp. G11-34]|uniref:permease-like cell division protein FtsX n=1 Tax=Sporosarcina sp. G11-34 TaxID=2849605 RepID=UPI0022A9DCEA|nr:permease-like cell division protein FtsX [Sporosarcina sp. G11-34]MCZ2257683.1 permease-like cell division protein FtsX [Sporosarcina sp. G11-34]
MKARTIKRHFRESFKSIGRNGWMTFASISAVTVTLLLVGVFIVIMMNLNKMADNIENDVEIKMTVDLIADEAAVAKLEEQLNAMDGVLDVEYSSNEKELDKMIEGFGDELGLYKQDNPLRHAFYIKASDPQQTPIVAKKIESFEYVYEVVYGEGKVEKLFNVLNSGRNVGLALILGLLFTATFLISNTIRITIVARRKEIEIMKLVGATNNFVRVPFLLEGIWLGILGAILPMIIITIAYWNLHKYLSPKLEGEFFQLLNMSPFLYQLNGLMLLMGVFIGVWGSFMSVRKFLKV